MTMTEIDLERLRKEAEECRQQAEKTVGPIDKEAWLRLAADWTAPLSVDGAQKLIERLGVAAEMPHAAACCRLRSGGPWNRYTYIAGFHGPSLDRKHRRLHGGSRQAHPEYLGEMSVQDGPQRRVDLVLGSVILAILSSPAIVIIGWMIVQSV
jgi:hypothetical protein